jgi:ATPase subunit of ABC transporter with duplicated ATPase domains
VALQYVAWEKQQKELAKHQEIIQRLSGGAQSGRAAQAEKAIERMKEEGLIEKPFVAKKRSFTFPTVSY